MILGQVIDIPGGAGPLEFRYDEEWLAITRAYHSFLPLHETPAQIGYSHSFLNPHLSCCAVALNLWTYNLLCPHSQWDAGSGLDGTSTLG